MSISIIIPTLNRPQELKGLLNRLNEVVKNEEVIIIDDSELNQESELLLIAKFSFKYINRGKKLGVSSARNLGASVSTSRYFLFFDDDDDFEANWLSDFRKYISEDFDLLFCNMLRIEANGRSSLISVTDNKLGAMSNRIVIPGAWIIRSNLFNEVGGFDETLFFAENTEFFMRVFKLDPNIKFIDKFNFIYRPSPMGGSKNLLNMIVSLSLILEKHESSLSAYTKHLYYQIIGVNYMRFRNFSNARKNLWISFTYFPWKPSTLIRLIISMVPPLAKKLYTRDVIHT